MSSSAEDAMPLVQEHVLGIIGPLVPKLGQEHLKESPMLACVALALQCSKAGGTSRSGVVVSSSNSSGSRRRRRGREGNQKGE